MSRLLFSIPHADVQLAICLVAGNMVFPVENMFGAASILAHNASDAAGVRILSVSRSAQEDPQFQLPTGQSCSWSNPTTSALPCSQWTPASPAAVAQFSALCYTTALYWAQTSGRPVGLINSAWGGTPVEAWMPPEAFAMCPQFPPSGTDANRAAAQTPALRAAQASGAVPLWEQSRGDEKEPGVNQYNDSALFNGMIAPLVGYSVRAAIWDQGERNSVEGWTEAHYSCYFGAMINSWRDLWGIGDFAFVFAQLAPYDTADNVTAIRMAQFDAMAREGGFMDTTGMTSQIDLGDLGSPFGSVHSRNKTEAGRRTALQLQHVMQGIQDVSFSWAAPTVVAKQTGPAASASGAITVSFDQSTLYNGSLRLLNAPNCSACCYGNNTFQVGASPAGPWINATAAIGSGGTTVIITPESSSVTPNFVRYAASNFPDCIITNNANIGTVPFVLPVGATLNTRSTRFDAHRPLLYAGADRDTLPSELGGLHRAFTGVGNVTRPPLYWNSWNAAHCNMDARIAMIQGDLAVKNNLPFANNGYIVHDDCWQVERHPDGTMRADPVRYPNGVSEVSTYLNDKGIGFGLYTARGSRTCQNRPGSYQHEQQDSYFYFQNNISYIKIGETGELLCFVHRRDIE